jgi:hypothetical protein
MLCRPILGGTVREAAKTLGAAAKVPEIDWALEGSGYRCGSYWRRSPLVHWHSVAVTVGRLKVGNAEAKNLRISRLEVDELVIGGKQINAEDVEPVTGSL